MQVPDAYILALRSGIRELSSRVEEVRNDCTYAAMRSMQPLHEVIKNLEGQLAEARDKVRARDFSISEMKVEAGKREARILSELERLHNQVRCRRESTLCVAFVSFCRCCFGYGSAPSQPGTTR